MFQIEDGSKEFWQWDINQRIIVNDETIKEVHYCNKTSNCSLVSEVYTENGKHYSNVPNILLQAYWNINLYGYDSQKTKYHKSIKVNARSKPADYIYTETEIKRYEDLEARIEELEEKEVDLSGYATKEEVGNIEAALDAIIAIQESYIGG